MAKIKRLRRKLHNAAQRNKEKQNAGTTDPEMMDASDLMPPPPPVDPTAIGARGDNLFKDVKIGSIDLVKQTLPDFDAQSTITSKTFKGLNLTKKEKRKLRHEAWMAKIDHIKAFEKKTKANKCAAQAPVIGNLTPMAEALSTVELLMKSSPKENKESNVPVKPKSTLPVKKWKAKMMKDISLFQQVLKHPLFVADEKRTISEHLKIAVEKEVT